MNRREFLKKTAKLSALAGIAYAAGGAVVSSASEKTLPYGLAAVRGGEPGPMFKKAIDALGGMGKFVKKGQSVLVKPNIGWDVSPEFAANTNPKLVSEIIKACFGAGASAVYVFDHTCDSWQECYKNSGIEAAAKEAGAKVVPGNSRKYYQKVRIAGGKALKEAEVHELVLNSDVFINVPVLKSHGTTKATIAMKNLMGIVWERRTWHMGDLHGCIADISTYRKPDLNIVDAYSVMMKNGPRGINSMEDIISMKALIASPDIVAADAAAAKLFGREPETLDFIKMAHERKAGNMNLNEINIARITM